MEKIKNVLLVIFAVIIVVLSLHWWGTREVKLNTEDVKAVQNIKDNNKSDVTTEDDVVAKDKVKYHTISDPPDTKVFQTQYNNGTQIVFKHKKHVEEYNLACIQCHHVENCTKCHLKNKSRKMEVEEGKVALHENCWRCHAELEAGPRKCDECHKQ